MIPSMSATGAHAQGVGAKDDLLLSIMSTFAHFIHLLHAAGSS